MPAESPEPSARNSEKVPEKTLEPLYELEPFSVWKRRVRNWRLAVSLVFGVWCLLKFKIPSGV